MKSARGWALNGAMIAAMGLFPAAATGEETTVNAADARRAFVAPLKTWPSATPASAPQTRDEPLTRGQMSSITPHGMPVLKRGEYGTDIDNENNANTHTPDGDMDAYLFNTAANAPIEYNIVLPAGSAGKAATLRMDVFDVDAAAGEADIVYVNGVRVGVLNGSDSAWGVNIFAIPPGVLVDGRNLVRIDIDTRNPGRAIWAVMVDWGIISLPTSTTPGITRCWVTPARQTRGDYVNFFAETTGSLDTVSVTVAGRTLPLTDPDRDGVWSGQWQIPAALPPAAYTMRFGATKASSVISTCPTLKVD